MKKNEKLLETLGEVDESLIPTEKENAKKSKKKIIAWASAIGGVCAAAAIGVFALSSLGLFGNRPGTEPDITTEITEEEPVTTTADTSETGTTAPAPESGDEDMEISYNRTGKSTVISDIVANSVKGDSILTDTSFTIKSTKELSVGQLMDTLIISPETDYTITKKADCEYILTANTAFKKGSVVKLSARSEEGGTGYSWAFQTVDDFRVKSVYPDDGSEFVSVDSGIEITFSEPVDLSSAKSCFSIDPAIDGELSTHGNTLYFIPRENMKYKTYYNVTVSEGIKSENNNVMKEGYSFSFCTTNSRDNFFTYNGISETFIMGDPVVIEVQGSDEAFKSKFDVKLYRYGNGNDYMSDLKDYNNKGNVVIDEGKMNEVFSSNEVPTSREDSWLPHLIMLPYDLEEGYYVASIRKGDTTLFYFIEMNPISVYSASFGDNTVFFINDTNTGKAAYGAEITLHTSKGDFSAKTDKKGVAQIVTKDNAYRTDTIEINYNGHRYIDLLMNYCRYKTTYDDLYYSYIYTDREAYKPTDTINIWGVIKPRRDGVKLPESLYVSFGQGETGGKSEKITPNMDGTFTAKISFADRQDSYWSSVRLVDGDNENAVICSKYVQILDYVKPNYTFDVNTPEYVVMPQKNPFDVTINAQYFDGTPASKLTFETYEEIYSGSTTTDENGIAAMKLLGNDRNSWRPEYYRISFGLTGIENNYQNATSYIYGFFRDVMLNSNYDEEKKTYTFETNKIDFSKIPEFISESKKYNYYRYSENDSRYDILKGEAYDAKIKVSITRNWYEKHESGSYYDYIEKKTVKKYDFEYCEENIGTFTVNTKNGKGVIKNLALDKEGSYYSIEISYEDSLGQTVDSYDSYSKRGGYGWYFTDYRTFRLCTDDNINDAYYWEEQKGNFKENQGIKFTLDEIYETGHDNLDGNIFFISYQNDIIDAEVYDSPVFTYNTDKRCIPNFLYCGAYFDGRHVYPIQYGSMDFDPSDREIILEASTDKDKYDAGEEVTLTVYAKDINGNPIKNAAVSLSVVDEAAFAVSQQNVNVLEDMYSYVWYNNARQKCSYIQHVMSGEMGGEKGGGDAGSDIRKDFRDNPYFGTVTTDAQGKAVIRFRLADSITTWRATLQSVCEIDGRMYAGNIKHPIVATRPVFITPIMLSEYTEGDDISVTAKCVGINEMDKLTVKLNGNGAASEIQILPFETANFGKLPKGEYTVTFSASNGVNSDAMEMPISVVDTKQEVRISKDISLEDIYSISPTKWPVSMMFYDKEYKFCKEILCELSSYYGDRLDMKAASDFAYSELGWDDSSYSEIIENATSSGYARLLTNGPMDIKLTALLCAAFPEAVSEEAVVRAFEDTLKKCDAEDMAYCYMGLAALGKPVISDIKQVLSENADRLTMEQKLYLTAGLALAGDYAGAYESYSELSADMKFYENRDGIKAYLGSQEQSRIALITASALNLPEAEPLARGLITNEPQYDSYSLELVVYIRNYVPKVSGDAQFSYSINGERKVVKLNRYGFCRLYFDKEQFYNADFRIESGSVCLYAGYMGRISEQPQSPTKTVSKTYSQTKGLKPGDTVTVTIKASPYSVIEDIIPSCARLSDEKGAYHNSVGQHIKLYTGKNGTATYEIRINTSGNFVTEGAYAYNYSDGVFNWGISGSGDITVEAVNEGA